MRAVAGVIMPFPGGVVRSGSKVGSKYKALPASTNDAWCPGLRGRPGSALAAEISEIDMSRREGPVLYTVDGVEVRLGVENWEERLARLEGVLAQVATHDVRMVDLRFRDQVVFQRGGS